MFGVFMLDLSFKETWAFEGELEMYIFLPEKDVSDLMASASSPYYKNQIIKTIFQTIWKRPFFTRSNLS